MIIQKKKFQILSKKNKSKYKLIKSKKNLGKGYALKLGVKRARYNWIFTMDSDLSVGFNEINKWIVNHELKKNYAYFGSRNHKDSIVKKTFTCVKCMLLFFDKLFCICFISFFDVITLPCFSQS